MCPVRNFERYLAIFRLLKTELSDGYAFRASQGISVLEDPFVASVACQRLKTYLQAITSDEGETLIVRVLAARSPSPCLESPRSLTLIILDGYTPI